MLAILSGRAVQVNNLQLMLLAIEGVGLCVIAMFWMWMLLQRVAAQRYSMLCVFMVRCLCAQSTVAAAPASFDEELLGQNARPLVRSQFDQLLILCKHQCLDNCQAD
jgi:hypothetical protein